MEETADRHRAALSNPDALTPARLKGPRSLAAKAPGSPVAGHATVFNFPYLNIAIALTAIQAARQR